MTEDARINNTDKLSLEEVEIVANFGNLPKGNTWVLIAKQLADTMRELELLKRTAIKTGILACDLALRLNKESDNVRD